MLYKVIEKEEFSINMNKRLLILLPAMALMLGACGESTDPTTSTSTSSSTDTSSTSSSSSSSSEGPSAADYGTQEAPLTVAQFLSNVDRLVAKTSGTFSSSPFYVAGISDGSAAFSSTYSTYDTIYLKDALTDSKYAKVQRSSRGEGIDADSIYKGDTLAIKGYAEYYDKSYSIFPDQSLTSGGEVVINSLTRGTSSFSASGDDHVSITETLESSYVNGTVLSLHVTLSAGFNVSEFKVNGSGISAESDGSYKVIVGGPTVVTVSSVDASIVEKDLPAGTYDVVVQCQSATVSNTGLTSADSTANVITKLAVVADSGANVYKKLLLTFSDGCKDQPKYGEFSIGKGKSLTISSPTGKISQLYVDAYKGINAAIYAGTTSVGADLTFTQDSTVTTKDHVAGSYAVDDASAYILCGTANVQSYFSLKITIVVA
jgi:hypothetical protein